MILELKWLMATLYIVPHEARSPLICLMTMGSLLMLPSRMLVAFMDFNNIIFWWQAAPTEATMQSFGIMKFASSLAMMRAL